MSGGASGIGSDIVRAFAANGSKVAFIDILEPDGTALAEETGSLFIKCDVTDIPALKAAIEQTRDQLGNISVLVNNAANDDRHKADAVTEEYWDRNQDINLKHQFFASQAVRPQMQALGGGSIINFSSIAWRGGGDSFPSYATAKAGVLGLTRALGRDFGSDNIRVNALEPGAVVTPRQIRLWYGSEDAVQAVTARQSIKRRLLGDEIARTVLFLAADDSRMITKQAIRVDGGLL